LLVYFFALMGYLSCKRQSTPFLISFWVLSLAVPVYLAYIYYQILKLGRKDILDSIFFPKDASVLPELFEFSSFVFLFMIGRIILLLFSVKLYMNFGINRKNNNEASLVIREVDQTEPETDDDSNIDDVIRNNFIYDMDSKSAKNSLEYMPVIDES